eukprot:TRINITY_DN28664_c0_g1_i1.p1 TRINITY_DN28664_c0_g1~~TRINITY_DN28664_c0_g1_i1.p1  ORF type:complete len:356 (+),score=55.63 TRINITY_DN28664_c0_g1_i1:111-1178(+)
MASSFQPLDERLQQYPQLAEALRTCCIRFVMNLPEDILRSGPRLCFELQQAFWFYLDYLYEDAMKELPKLSWMNFVHLMLEASNILRSIYGSVRKRNQVLQEWRQYSKEVPLLGAVLLDETLSKSLMVQPWKGDKWMYPRGKINEGENEEECATREVYEETGIDLSGMIDDRKYVAADVYGTGCDVKLFIVPGVSITQKCAPKLRKEISHIAWVNLCELPGWDPSGREGTLRFVAVEPFVADIKWWVEQLQWSVGSMAAVTKPSQAAWDCQDSWTGDGFSGRAVACRSARSPSSVRGEPFDVGGRTRDRVNGAASKPTKGSGKNKSGKRKEVAGLVMDMSKVMREFDRGWDEGVD